MPAMNGPSPDAPGMGELLRQSWRLLRKHLWTFILLASPMLPAMALVAAIYWFVLFREIENGPPFSTPYMIGMLLALLAAAAVSIRILGATTRVAAELHMGRDLRVWEALRRAAGKQARLLWLLFITGLFRGRLVFVPLFAVFFFSPALPVAALENLGVIKALQRGRALSKRHQEQIGLLMFLTGAAVFVVTSVAFRLLDLQYVDRNLWLAFPLPVLTGWFFLLIGQFYMITLTLHYLYMRARQDESVDAVPGPGVVERP